MLSKEELRVARLRRLGTTEAAANDGEEPEEPAEKKHQTESSSSPSAFAAVSAAPVPFVSTVLQPAFIDDGSLAAPMPLPQGILDEMRALLFPPRAPEEDVLRWHSQGFNFAQALPFGLKQKQGGPCGVLAAVQAELIRILIFGESSPNGLAELPFPPQERILAAFATALCTILQRTCPDSDHPRLYFVSTRTQGFGTNPFGVTEELGVSIYEDMEDARAFVLSSFDMYASEAGIILFTYSLLLTRGLWKIREDMDDSSACLTCEYGHCTQELLNLLLTSRATSQVFDGEKPMGDSGLVFKGVFQRPHTGYLSYLEALRYLEVGSYYKTPLDPIWVIGSAGHFTVLFSLTRGANRETESEQILSRARRAFLSVDINESGMISSSQLSDVVSALELPVSYCQQEIAQLRDHLQIEGGLIVWDSFWTNVSRLMTGTPLATLVGNTTGGATAPLRVQSDWEIAHELQLAPSNSNKRGQAKLDSEERRPRSDSDFARMLQAQFDEMPAEAVVPDVAPTVTSAAPAVEMVEDRAHIHRHDSVADEQAEGFRMVHYNGLENNVRQARATPFTLYRRSADNCVGQIVALGAAHAVAGSADLCPIEAVLKTKWEGCRIDWGGLSPPGLD